MRWIGASGAVLLLAAFRALPASAQAVSGRVLDPDGAAVPGAVVQVILERGVDRSVIVGPNGQYEISLAGVAAGTYDLRADRIGFRSLIVRIDVVSGNRSVISRDLRLTRTAIELPGLEARAARPAQRPPQARTPGGDEEAIKSFLFDGYPVTPGDLGEIAAYKPGVIPLGQGDGLAPRVSIAGQHPSQNGVTLDGASFGASAVPAEALRTTSVITSTYDVSRGQFSGGQIAATTRSGTNLFGGAIRFRYDHPALQFGTTTAADVDPYTAGEVSGGAGGAVIRERLFWYAAVQASRRSSQFVTLADAYPSALSRLGVSSDSAARFRRITDSLGLAIGRGAGDPNAVSERGSALVRADLHLSDQHTLTTRLDARVSRQRGLGGSPFALHGNGTSLESTSAGVLLQLASYIGAVRNELRVYRSEGDRRIISEYDGPTGMVLVKSEGGSGLVTTATLRAGNGAYFGSNARSATTEVADELLVKLSGNDRHRAKIGFLISRDEAREEGAPNTAGTFSFRSLADFEEGRPASFTRTIGEASRVASTEYAALFAGHFWRASRGLWIINGLRAEARRYPGVNRPGERPQSESDASSDEGIRAEWGLSPRAGFTYESADRNLEVHGGIGVFRGRLPLSSFMAASAAGGGLAQLVCLGPAVPTPNWRLNAPDPSTVPTQCADESSQFARSAAEVTVFSTKFRSPGTWHASLGMTREVMRGRHGHATVYADATAIRGFGQPIAVDANLARDLSFTLSTESDRPVFASPAEIDPATGLIAPRAARVDPTLGTIREIRADGTSSVAQFTIGTTVLTPRLSLLSVYYTYTAATDEVTGIPSPAGFSAPVSGSRPNGVLRAPSDLDRRHSIQLHAIRPFGRWVEVGMLGRLTSGEPYTPLVDGDINGDGFSNDPAFVFAPASTPDARLGEQLTGLISASQGETRACITHYLGRLAERNGCRAPWSASLDMQVNLRPPRNSRLARGTATVIAGNVLGGVDRLMNGENARGWGDVPSIDPVLLQVRGFDPVERAFRYEVNPSFGATSGARNNFRRPFTLTITARITVGADPARQPFQAMLSAVRVRGRSPAVLRGELASRIPNLPGQVLSVADSLRLELSEEQRVRLAAAADTARRRLGQLADSLASNLSVVETGSDPARLRAARAEVQRLVVEAEAYLEESTLLIRSLLSAEQWSLLPAAIREPSRQLLPERTITVGGGGGEAW
jgi:hypothetical protein